MTRQEIEASYDIEDGVIRSPGKFEGEMLYVPYFWDAFLDGFADEDDESVMQFEISEEDRKNFPEIPANQKTVALYEREDGFVCEVIK